MARTPRTKAARPSPQDSASGGTRPPAPPGRGAPASPATDPAASGAQAAAPAASVPPEGQGGAGEGGGGAPSPAAPAQASGLIVWVTGPKAGRWRIGRQFGPDPVGIPLDELSEQQKAALIADPQLTTEIYALPDED